MACAKCHAKPHSATIKYELFAEARVVGFTVEAGFVIEPRREALEHISLASKDSRPVCQNTFIFPK